MRQPAQSVSEEGATAVRSPPFWTAQHVNRFRSTGRNPEEGRQEPNQSPRPSSRRSRTWPGHLILAQQYPAERLPHPLAHLRIAQAGDHQVAARPRHTDHPIWGPPTGNPVGVPFGDLVPGAGIAHAHGPARHLPGAHAPGTTRQPEAAASGTGRDRLGPPRARAGARDGRAEKRSGPGSIRHDRRGHPRPGSWRDGRGR